MSVVSRNAFGKLQRDDAGAIAGWHPLIDHMIDVAACFQQLCRCHAIERGLENAAGRRLQATDVARLSVLAFLHDVGKANSGFQAKRWDPAKHPPEWPPRAGHGGEALVLFTETCESLAERLPVDAIERWGEATWSLLIASISHHGRPIVEVSPLSNRQHAVAWKAVIGTDGRTLYDPAAVLDSIGAQATVLFPEAFVQGGEPLPESPAFGHLFAGLVQLADWLGSDSDLFPYSKDGEQRSENAARHAAEAVAAVGLDVDAWRERAAELSPAFAEIFGGNPPYPVQAAMGDPALGPLVILESETGSGKTEAALWRYVQLFQSGQVDSLFFALPTRVSASQVYGRVQKAVKRLWPDAAPVVVRALPGYTAADGHEPKALPNFEVQWPDDPDDKAAQHRWAAESPKRFLAAPIAVGTIDQALFSALQVPHAHLRHALLTRSLLVVDEVHASDPYMTVLLERLLKAHLRCGGHALLLSATLGSSARDRYLGLSSGLAAPSCTTDFDAASAVAYPAVSDFSGIKAVPSPGRSKKVEWSLHDSMDDPARIARLALDAAREGAKVLVIRNTVPGAVAVLKALEESGADPASLFNVNGVVTLHHGRFSRDDRPLLDAAVETQLGKERPPGPCIAIGTQTLEQSLDLDADLLITDLCPMDVLLQRIGRLHRHSREDDQRPSSFRKPQAWILTPAGHELEPLLNRPSHGLGPSPNGGGGIYPDLRAVEATRRLIGAHLTVTIPADNRYLVEAATHPDRLRAIEQEGGEAWERLAQRVEGEDWAQKTVGHQSALELDKPFDEQQPFPKEVGIATRLGAKDRLLRFDPAIPGPFGAPLRALPVRSFLVPSGVDPDAEPTVVAHDNGTTEFTLGTYRYRYSRLGLERLKDD